MTLLLFRRHGRQAIFFFSLAWCLLVFAMPCCGAAAASGNFPEYPTISKNIKFWEKIYAVYSLQQAVIHDSEDLSRVYQVVNLVDLDSPGAQRQNSAIQKQACERYSNLLRKLADAPPRSPEEQRVAGLFPGKNGRAEMAAAAENVRSQSGQKERFLAGVIKSGEYLAEIKNILQSYGLPTELAHLPHVESSFNFKAYSRIGAAGLWQFTRDTGKQYLTVNNVIDERLDPIASTHAAAKYLLKSYQRLNSWPLAITSYNYGLAGMLRAVNEHTNYEDIFNNYKKGHFKFASKNFYAEFLAARNVAQYLEKTINRPAAKANHQYLNLTVHADIKELARYYNIPVGTIADLNPALRPPILSGEKRIPAGYKLRLPLLDKTPQLASTRQPVPAQNEQRASRGYQVRQGDTAAGIARLHKISLKSLVQANNLDHAATIRPGQKLVIPQTAPANNERQAAGKTSRISIQKNVTTKDSLPAKEGKKPS